MSNHIHITDFFVTGFKYYEGCMVFNKLKIGTELKLVRETENRYEPEAVAIYFQESKIGFIPRSENNIISKFIDQGYADAFEVRCNRILPEAAPNHQVGVVIFLKKLK